MTVKYVYNVIQDFNFKWILLLFLFLFIKNELFLALNKTCFLSKSANLNNFVKDHVTLKAGIMAGENSVLSSQEQMAFKNILQ